MTDSGTRGTTAGSEVNPNDPFAILRSRDYLRLLILAAIVGIPISAVAYGFLKLVSDLQKWFYTTLPSNLGFHSAPGWWPLPLLAVAGLLVALTIQYLPGTGGHLPAEGLKIGGGPLSPVEL